MVTEAKDRQVNTETPVRSDDEKRLPHERDESPDGHPPKARSVIRQAASDLEQGLVDTDLHGVRGVEKVQPRAPGKAQPQAGVKQD
ncbi:hypothetical protein ASD15_01180 [Massilia sp. Root351]|jgi:hypothetical protein|uniref:hypothetical protein n=1 Tax=Massilia sp. Root351 TaxID=1736522 RepID=UPI00070F2E7D|nr:hypothetical protein [Massilia sp. Root351]KQV90721.1 hypothetical protein ASD15_01180 [Massilia sp. Root351]